MKLHGVPKWWLLLLLGVPGCGVAAEPPARINAEFKPVVERPAAMHEIGIEDQLLGDSNWLFTVRAEGRQLEIRGMLGEAFVDSGGTICFGYIDPDSNVFYQWKGVSVAGKEKVHRFRDEYGDSISDCHLVAKRTIQVDPPIDLVLHKGLVKAGYYSANRQVLVVFQNQNVDQRSVDALPLWRLGRWIDTSKAGVQLLHVDIPDHIRAELAGR